MNTTHITSTLAFTPSDSFINLPISVLQHNVSCVKYALETCYRCRRENLVVKRVVYDYERSSE